MYQNVGGLRSVALCPSNPPGKAGEEKKRHLLVAFEKLNIKRGLLILRLLINNNALPAKALN